MGLVDTHCHLQDARFDNDRERVIQSALETVDWLIVVGDTLATSRAAVELARDRVYATVGIHPHHAEEATPDILLLLRALARRPHVVALGEIGLDYFYEHAPRPVQRDALTAQLDLARQAGLPVVIHNRNPKDGIDAQTDLTAVLNQAGPPLPSGVMHCFSGDAAFAEQCIEWGFHISFAGNLTFPKAHPLRDAALHVPDDRLLVETDSPYLAPQPVRGQRCEPSHVRYTAEILAGLKGKSLDEFAQQTTENAERLFGIRRTHII
ncbi:MAG: TatD family hydrolase [Candidatus Hydrogenedentes bacterium]|nr:TatD family hydrolase [Candidatus Hydrogenedentota bacterium]